MRSADEIVVATARATARDRQLIAAKRGIVIEDSSDQLGALVDAARALSEAGIAYVVIGGLAVGIHSDVPRATQDVDIAVASSVPREAIVTTLRTAGFEHRGTHEHSENFRHASGEPVRVAIDGSFDTAIDRAPSYQIGGASVRVVAKDDLIAMKERAASDPARRPSKAHRDRADLEQLKGDVPDPDEGW
jgi:predicted nucleotidyltransferase